jgi:hypothetical protein
MTMNAVNLKRGSYPSKRATRNMNVGQVWMANAVDESHGGPDLVVQDTLGTLLQAGNLLGLQDAQCTPWRHTAHV